MPAAKVAQMTRDEFQEMIETTVERKLLELLGEPDEGLSLKKSVRERLVRQQEVVQKGERGRAFEEVTALLGCSNLA